MLRKLRYINISVVIQVFRFCEGYSVICPAVYDQHLPVLVSGRASIPQGTPVQYAFG